MSDAPRTGSVGEVFLAALRLGLTSFGGPVAHIGYFRREYVDRRRWLDDAEFGEYLALSQSLPGPASSQLGIAIGTRRAGIPGGAAAWLGFTLPSAALLVAFALVASATDVASAGWVHGLKLAAVAIVAQAVWVLARSLAPDWSRKAIAVGGFLVALVWVDPAAQVAIIAAGAAIGLLALNAPPSGRETHLPSSTSRVAAVGALAVFAVLLALTPLARAPGVEPSISMTAAIYRAGALVFGGGHVVLPLLHAGVVDPGWVSENQFLAGYGAAQAVPGPLFSFAAYLGAIGTPLGGIGGAIVALLAIYLPSFLLLLGVLPFWAGLRESPAFRRALTGVNAAVVGLLAAALYRPVWTGAVDSSPDLAVVAVALAALVVGRLPPIVVVVGCAVAGQSLAALGG
ncbi:MAG TPA: chromate efflux transporter [Candidatus Limnocylindrales bacterium]|nr:chromate efflux transporter [Candidatus Limnocylindrales bacterium]